MQQHEIPIDDPLAEPVVYAWELPEKEDDWDYKELQLELYDDRIYLSFICHLLGVK